MCIGFIRIVFSFGVIGKSVMKGYISMCFGLMVATIGLDPITATPRYNFDTVALQQGISFIPVMIGMFALPTIIESLIISKDFKFPSLDKNFKQCLVGVYDAFKEILQSKFNIIRSSVIGSIIGAIPGTGSAIAATLSYQLTKKLKNLTTMIVSVHKVSSHLRLPIVQ